MIVNLCVSKELMGKHEPQPGRWAHNGCGVTVAWLACDPLSYRAHGTAAWLAREPPFCAGKGFMEGVGLVEIR